MAASEVIKSVTAAQLNAVIDAELSAHQAQAEDAEHIVTWLSREYPEFVRFAHDCVSRYFEDPAAADSEAANLIIMNTAITLGALCKAVEARELLGD